MSEYTTRRIHLEDMAYERGYVHWATEPHTGKLGLQFLRPDWLEVASKKRVDLNFSLIDEDDDCCFLPIANIFTHLKKGNQVVIESSKQDHACRCVESLEPCEVNTNQYEINFIPVFCDREPGIVFMSRRAICAFLLGTNNEGENHLSIDTFSCEPLKENQMYFVSCEKMMQLNNQPHRIVDKGSVQYIKYTPNACPAPSVHKTPNSYVVGKSGSDGNTVDADKGISTVVSIDSGVTTKASESSNSAYSSSPDRYAENVYGRTSDDAHTDRLVSNVRTTQKKTTFTSPVSVAKSPSSTASLSSSTRTHTSYVISDADKRLKVFVQTCSLEDLKQDKNSQRKQFTELLDASEWKDCYLPAEEYKEHWWCMERVIAAPWLEVETSPGHDMSDVGTYKRLLPQQLEKGIDYFWDQLDVLLFLQRIFKTSSKEGCVRPRRVASIPLHVDFSDTSQWTLNGRISHLCTVKFSNNQDIQQNHQDIIKLLIHSGWSKEIHPTVLKNKTDYGIDGCVLIPHWYNSALHPEHGITSKNIVFYQLDRDYFISMAEVMKYLVTNGNQQVTNERRAKLGNSPNSHHSSNNSGMTSSAIKSSMKPSESIISSSAKKFGKAKSAYVTSPSATQREITQIGEAIAARGNVLDSPEPALMRATNKRGQEQMITVKVSAQSHQILPDSAFVSPDRKRSALNRSTVHQTSNNAYNENSPAMSSITEASCGTPATPPKTDIMAYCDYLLDTISDQKTLFHEMWHWLKKQCKWVSCYQLKNRDKYVYVPIWNKAYIVKGELFDCDDQRFEQGVDYFLESEKGQLITYMRDYGPNPRPTDGQKRERKSEIETKNTHKRARDQQESNNNLKTPPKAMKRRALGAIEPTTILTPGSSQVSSVGSLSPYTPAKTDHAEYASYLIHQSETDEILWEKLWKWLKVECKWQCVYATHNKDVYVHVPVWNTRYITKDKFDIKDSRFISNVDYFVEKKALIAHIKAYGPCPRASDNDNIAGLNKTKYDKYIAANDEYKKKELANKKQLKKAELQQEELSRYQKRLKKYRRMEEKQVRLQNEKIDTAAAAAVLQMATPASPPNEPRELIIYTFEHEKDLWPFNKIWRLLKEDFKWATVYPKKTGLDARDIYVPSWALSCIEKNRIDTESLSGRGIHYFDDKDYMLNYVRKFGVDGPPTSEQLKELDKLHESDPNWWMTYEDPNPKYPIPAYAAAGMHKDTHKLKRKRVSGQSSKKSVKKALRHATTTDRVVHKTSAVILRTPNTKKTLIQDTRRVDNSFHYNEEQQQCEVSDENSAETSSESDEEDLLESDVEPNVATTSEESSDGSESEEEEVQQNDWRSRARREWREKFDQQAAALTAVPPPVVPTASVMNAIEPYAGPLSEAIELAERALAPGNIPSGNIGRETEYATLQATVDEAIRTCVGGNIYICGPPGTGKTHFTKAALSSVCSNCILVNKGNEIACTEQSESDITWDAATVTALTGISRAPSVYRMHNAMNAPVDFVIVHTIGTGMSEGSLCQQIFAAIYPFLTPSVRNNIKRAVTSGKSAGDGSGTKESLAKAMKKAVIEYLSCSSCKPVRAMVVLVVDEVDNAPKPILKELLELAPEIGSEYSTLSNLLCIGIANSLNYPAEIGLSNNAHPQVILFKPYGFDALSKILRSRMHGLMQYGCEALIARKVASKNGDVRLLLQVAQQSLHVAIEQLVSPPLEMEGEEGIKRALLERTAMLDGPSKNIVKTATAAYIFQSIGMGTSRVPEMVDGLSSIARAVLVGIVTSDPPEAMQLPAMLTAYNSYAEQKHLNDLTKDDLRRWVDHLVGYNLLRRSDDSSVYTRRKVESDKVNYRLQCHAVDILRAKNLEQLHRHELLKYVQRKNKDEEIARLLAENL